MHNCQKLHEPSPPPPPWDLANTFEKVMLCHCLFVFSSTQTLPLAKIKIFNMRIVLTVE
jgi:hypothetical protein